MSGDRKRIDDLRNLYISTDRDDDFRRHLSAILTAPDEPGGLAEARRFGVTLETRGLVVTGASAQGKTSLIAKGLERFAGLSAGCELGLLPTLHVDVPSPATLKSLGAEIVRATGFNFSGSNERQHRVWEHARHRLALTGVRVLWIDEAHDVFRTGSVTERHNILNTVKTLMKGEHAVVPILSGLPMLEGMIRSDEQVSRRLTKFPLPEVSWERDGANIRDIASDYCERMGMLSEMDEEALSALAAVSGFSFGRVIEGIIDAIELALGQGADRVDRQHLAEAWTDREGLAADPNPFFVGAWR